MVRFVGGGTNGVDDKGVGRRGAVGAAALEDDVGGDGGDKSGDDDVTGNVAGGSKGRSLFIVIIFGARSDGALGGAACVVLVGAISPAGHQRDQLSGCLAPAGHHLIGGMSTSILQEAIEEVLACRWCHPAIGKPSMSVANDSCGNCIADRSCTLLTGAMHFFNKLTR